METGIGPAIRVFRHFTERKRFQQIKFASGERAVVLIAGMPAPSIELVRLVLGGFMPWQTVWEYNPMRAGGYSDYIHKLKAMFSPATEESDDSLHHMRDALLRCRSINEARTLLLERERLANSSTPELAWGLTRHNPRRSATSNDSWELGINASQKGPSAEWVKTLAVPNRYRITNGAKEKILTCVEAPTVTVRDQRRVQISAKQARNYPPGNIFLDGAAQGEPFADFEKALYNLDHHQGCIQSLATCEQATVLIRKLLDLRTRDWVVLANDGDLDTIFAVWVLLNHLRLSANSEVLARVMPLLRLEGVIDAHGLDATYLSALPPDLLRSTSTMLKELQQQELIFKHYGQWAEIDLLEYIADRLRAIDELIYSPEDFDGLPEIDELARAEIANGSVVVACHSAAGINEVERQLRRIYGERLGVLIFQNAPSTYDVRQVDRALSTTLERAYEHLNLLDPAVRGGSQNRWGGSAEIGASPRDTDTGLMPGQIVAAVRDVFRHPTIIDVISEIPQAGFLTLAALLPALTLIVVGNLLRDRGYIAPETVLLSAVIFPVTAGILFWLKARRTPGLYGWRAPTGFGWLIALPAAFIAAVTGGVWTPGSLGYGIEPQNLNGFTAFLLPIGAELLFRGVILGSLASRLPIQRSGGHWWRSWPTLISSALYAAASVLLLLSLSSGEIQMSRLLVTIEAALTFGIASGITRERSESIFSSVLLHSVCAAALILSGGLLF
ncbi:MAG: CPBP family glutamic-type intramembrane protease [Candidatus Binatia bacterium]